MASKKINYIIETLKNYLNRAYLNSLFIAFVLWSLIKFSANYQSRIECEVALVNIPETFIQLDVNTKTIKCNLKTTGFRSVLIKYWENPKLKIGFDQLKKNEDGTYFTNLDIYAFKDSPDWLKESQDIQFDDNQLFFQIEKRIKVKVPILPKTTFSCKPGYIIENTQLNIDSVWVTMPESHMSNELFVSSKKIVKNQLNKSEKFKVHLEIPKFWAIDSKVNKILLQVEIDQLTQGQFELNLSPDPQQKVTYFPSKVLVQFSVPSKEFNNVSDDLFKVEAQSVNTIENTSVLNVFVTSKPANVNILSIQPPKVEFLVFDEEEIERL